MEVRNCRSCKRLFNYIGGTQICPACREELEDKFQKVKEFLRENPNSSIEVVSEENQVSPKQLKQWVREERLKFSDDSPVGIECEICGTTIKTGRYCDACRNKVQANLMKGIDKPKTIEKRNGKEKEHMRFL